MKQPTPDVEVVNTIQGVKSLADGIAVLNSSHKGDVPLLYINIEPNSLGADGELNLLAIMLCYGPKHRRRLFLVDVNRLANQAFSTRGYYGASLRSILDSASYRKIFFDVGHDSHILYAQYGIKLQGVCDLQLMENALSLIKGHEAQLEQFEPLIERLLVRGKARNRWFLDKFNGEWLYKYGAGAPHRAFRVRPVMPRIRLYCCRNVRLMAELYSKLFHRVSQVMDQVLKQSMSRVGESQMDDFDALASGWYRNSWTAEQMERFHFWAGLKCTSGDLKLGNGII